MDILGAHSVHITVIKHYLLPTSKKFNLKQQCQKLTGRQRNTIRYKNHEKGGADIVIPPRRRDKEDKKLLFLSGAIELRSIISACAVRIQTVPPERSTTAMILVRTRTRHGPSKGPNRKLRPLSLSPRTVKTT